MAKIKHYISKMSLKSERGPINPAGGAVMLLNNWPDMTGPLTNRTEHFSPKSLKKSLIKIAVNVSRSDQRHCFVWTLLATWTETITHKNVRRTSANYKSRNSQSAMMIGYRVKSRNPCLMFKIDVFLKNYWLVMGRTVIIDICFKYIYTEFNLNL